jgi:ABC-type glutathione transport system ATPase component
MSLPVLNIQDLSIHYQTEQGPLQALRDVNLQVPEGKIIGIIGESGCGKSTLISAIIRLLAPNARIGQGSVNFKGRDLLRLSRDHMRALRGDEISMVCRCLIVSVFPIPQLSCNVTRIISPAVCARGWQ